MRVHCSWDSSPFGTYFETDEPVGVVDSYDDTKVIEVPNELWERYVVVRKELYDIEKQFNAIKADE